MSLEYAFYALLVFTMLREVYFMRQVHKLVNKIMCRSLHEYRLAESVQDRQEPQVRFVDDGPDEDLGALTGIV